MAGPWSTTDFSEIKKGKASRGRGMSICCQKSLPETCTLRALELQPKLGKEWERYWNVFVPKPISIYKGVEGSWGLKREWKRCRQEIDVSKSKMLSVYLCGGDGVGGGEGENWSTVLSKAIKKSGKFSTVSHNLLYNTINNSHLYQEQKYSWSNELSKHWSVKMLMRGLRLHKCSCVCVKSRLSVRGYRRNCE